MKRVTVLASAIVAAMSFSAFAQEGQAPAQTTEKTEAKKKVLAVGDAAPALSIAEWVKGKSITGFEKGQVYVVEFWATWCGPCVASMPHLTELQHQYSNRGVTIVGVTAVDPNNSLDKVKKMVTDKGDTIGYTIAWDDESKTNNAFMKAAKRNGIPCSFVVDQKGNIAYIGHPMGLDPVLASVVDGKWDYVEGPKMIAKISQTQREIMEKAETDPAAALRMLNELNTQHPHTVKSMLQTKYALLSETGDAAGASAVAGTIITDAVAKKDPGTLNELAWGIVDPEAEVKSRDVDLALRAAIEADKLTESKDPAILDTLARCYWLKGEKAKAVELQKKAVGLAKGQMKTELEKSLTEYEAGAKN